MQDFELYNLIAKLIDCALKSLPLDNNFQISYEDAVKIYNLSSKNDVAGIVGAPLIKSGILSKYNKVESAFKKQIDYDTLRLARQSQALEEITKIFNQNNVNYAVLKGVVIRTYYPNPIFRMMTDIDVLVSPVQISLVKNLLESINYKFLQRNAREYDFVSPMSQLVEIHVRLCDDKSLAEHETTVFDSVKIVNGVKTIDNKLFLTYFFWHVKKHFTSGGCGIRPLIDLYCLIEFNNFDLSVADEELKKLGLLEFKNQFIHLVNSLWYGKEFSTTSTQLLNYLFSGGAYGNSENRVKIGSAESGKFKYFISRVFPPYYKMEFLFPTLQKCKLLLPFYYVKRWFLVTFSHKRKYMQQEISSINKVCKQSIQELSKLKKDLGI